jgi:FkbM family methyltransferase
MNLAILKKWLKVKLGKDLYVQNQMDCPKLHYGEKDYDWTFCPVSLDTTSIVYSFGIGRNISFDLALIENFGVNVYAFDPTPKSLSWLEHQDLPTKFLYYPWGLSDYDGTMDFHELGGEQAVSYTGYQPSSPIKQARPLALEVLKFSTICSRLGHDHIHLLKMDIEGSEYRAIPDILNSSILVDQILVEFHHRFDGISVRQTSELIEILNAHGYYLFNVPPNGYEYSFLRKVEAI